MWRRLYSAVDWSRQAPRWSAVLLAGLAAADLAHTAAGLRTTSVPPPPPAAQPRRVPHTVAAAAWRITHAHLFGSEKARPGPLDPNHAPETQLALALTGTLATGNPNEGYAILGEKGKPEHLYRTGVVLGEGLSGRLYQTYTDRVVLELDGHLETLRLPRQAIGLANAPGATTVAAADTAAATSTDDTPTPTAAESWFELLHPQSRFVGNRNVGIKLRPDVRVQRQFDLRYNDVLTAINGVEISGPSSAQDLESALKSAAGKSLQLTVTRDGVEQLLTVPVAE